MTEETIETTGKVIDLMGALKASLAKSAAEQIAERDARISSLESQLEEARRERDTAREVGTVSYERAELAEGKLHTLRKALGLPDLEIKGFLDALEEARRDTERLDLVEELIRTRRLGCDGSQFYSYPLQHGFITYDRLRAAIDAADSARGAPHD